MFYIEANGIFLNRTFNVNQVGIYRSHQNPSFYQITPTPTESPRGVSP